MTFSIPSYSLEIRPVGQDDLEAILEVYKQCEDFLALGPVAAASRDMILKDMEVSKAENGVFCGVFNASGEMIGVLDHVPDHYRGEPQTAYIELFMLAASLRERGIGRAVLTALENEVQRRGSVNTILLEVQVNNPRALQFWERNGYRIVSGPALKPDQTNAVDLRKDLGSLRKLVHYPSSPGPVLRR